MNQESLPLILLTLILLVLIPTCICQNEYDTCVRTFNCGSFTDTRYPFYGGNRSLSCGYPGFELICRGEGAPLINISSLIYRVLDIDYPRQVLRVARNDLWSDICTQILINTTLNLTPFNFYQPAGDQDITLFYGCYAQLPQIIPLPYRFQCTANRINGPAFFAVVVPDTVLTCNTGISVRVNESAAAELANPATASVNVLRVSIQGGFSVQWSAEDEKCRECVGSNGTCGFDRNASSFVCHCDDGSYDSICQNASTNQNGTRESFVNCVRPMPMKIPSVSALEFFT